MRRTFLCLGVKLNLKEKLESEADGMFLCVDLVLEEANSDDHPYTRTSIFLKDVRHRS